MSDDSCRSLVRGAIANRGAIYLHLLDALEKRLGRAEAEAVMAEALRARGAEGALSYSDAARNGDLEALAEEFVARREGDADAFCRGAEPPRGDELRLTLGACPLVDAWKAAGRSESEIDRLCQVASAVDYGKFEDGLGLELDFDERIAAGDRRCVLHLRRGKRPA